VGLKKVYQRYKFTGSGRVEKEEVRVTTKVLAAE
jgi:hypothetical protein